MIIKCVKLKNYRQFYGEQVVNFSIDKEKNVTLIHAENGVGKTALLNAIKWCLFKTFTDNFINSGDLLNHQAADESKQSLIKVEVDFITTENDHFRAVRTPNGFDVYPIVDRDSLLGQSLGEKKAQEFVNTVLPPEMSEYFFFQGEGSSALKKGKVSNTQIAIKDILGFRPATQAISDLSDISKDYNKQISMLNNENTALLKISTDISNSDEEIKMLESKIINLNDNINNAEIDISNIDEKLKGLDSAAVESLRSERINIEAKITKNNNEIESNRRSKNALIGEFGWSVFGKEFGEKVFDYIDESQLKGRLPEPYNKTLIDDILKEKLCICGNSIEDGTEARLKIESLLNKAVDPQLQSRVFNVKAWAQKLSDDHSGAFSSLTKAINKEKEAFSKQDEYDRAKDRIERAFDKFEGDPDSVIEAAKIANLSRREKEKSLRHNIHELGKSEGRLEEARKRLHRLKIERSKHSNNDHQKIALEEQQSAVDLLCKKISDVLTNTEKDTRNVLLKLVSDNIKKFLRNDYSVRLESDFSVSLVNAYKKTVNLSDGQRLLLNMVFTASLIKHAENRLNAKGGILLPGTTAPFVIDAPFGELDKTYRGHVANILPSYARQVVLFLSSSHWEGEVESNIRSSVGKEYYIKLHENSNKGDKKIDSIKVLGKEYILNAYDAEKSYSEIIEMEVPC